MRGGSRWEGRMKNGTFLRCIFDIFWGNWKGWRKSKFAFSVAFHVEDIIWKNVKKDFLW